MKKLAVAGISVASLAAGSVAVAVAVPIGAALAQEGESTTTIQPEASAPEAAPPEAGRRGEAGLGSLFGHFEGAGLASVLDSLVKDGTITEEQSAAITARFAARAQEGRAKFEAEHPRLAEAKERLGEASKRWAERGDQFAAKIGAELDEVSAFLGLSTDELKSRLASESLAAIAGDKAPELVTMLSDKANARIDEAVASGSLSEERANEIKAKTADRIEKALDFIGGDSLREHLKGFFEGRGGR